MCHGLKNRALDFEKLFCFYLFFVQLLFIASVEVVLEYVLLRVLT